jgi:hypothetical protein
MQGECASSSSSRSESLLCDDLHRTGFTKAVIDAGVLLTHDLDVSVKFTPLIKAADRAPYLRRSRWVEVQGSGSPWEMTESGWQEVYRNMQCCKGGDAGRLVHQQAGGGVSGESQEQQQQHQRQEGQGLLIVDEMVQAVAASGRQGPPLPLRGWDATECRSVDVLSRNHTETYLERMVSV